MDNYHGNWWTSGVFHLRGSVIPNILSRVILCSTFGFLVALVYYIHPPGVKLYYPSLATVSPGLVLGLLLVFRTNTAYERFWEGRKIWGSITNINRSLARQIWVSVETCNEQEKEEKIHVMRLVIAFALALKLGLRKQSLDVLEALVGSQKMAMLRTAQNPPLEITFWVDDYIHRQYKKGRLEPNQRATISSLLNQQVDNCGACDRIVQTPMPFAYSIHLRQLVVIYCLMIPFQVVKDLGWLTVFATAFMSFTLLGIEEIGLEIENPFGTDPNDLPLDRICEAMHRNIEDLMVLNPDPASMTLEDVVEGNPGFSS